MMLQIDLFCFFRYSTDEGETWHKYTFANSSIRIHGLLTEPGEKTTVVFLFGSQPDAHSWLVMYLNLSKVFGGYPQDPYYRWTHITGGIQEF